MSIDAGGSLQLVLAFLFVLALIGLASLVARRFGLAPTPRSDGRRRLAVVEVLSLDPKRRLVLLRRDGVEHLVILGPASETVVESAIPAAGAVTGGSRFGAVLRAAGGAPDGAGEHPAHVEEAPGSARAEAWA